MKKLSILCSSLLLALMMCFPVFASEDLRYVEDNADLLTVSEQQELNDTLTEISERQGVDVAVITADDMGDQSMMVLYWLSTWKFASGGCLLMEKVLQLSRQKILVRLVVSLRLI